MHLKMSPAKYRPCCSDLNVWRKTRWVLTSHKSYNFISNMHYSDVIMGTKAFQITSLTIVCSPVYSGAYQRKNQSSVSLAFVRGIHRWPVNSSHKWSVTRKMFLFDDVIMDYRYSFIICFKHKTSYATNHIGRHLVKSKKKEIDHKDKVQ